MNQIEPRGSFTDRQRKQLLAPITPWRIFEKDGQSHLAAFDVIAHLNRMFGFEGWEKEILSIEPIYERAYMKQSKRQGGGEYEAFDVAYRCILRLTIYDADGNVVTRKEDGATGDATAQRTMADAHDLAFKSAISGALKRCAKDLGDQFGLSLYNKGQREAVVVNSLPYMDESEFETPEVDIKADGIDEHDGHEKPDESEPEAAPAEPAPTVREPEPAKPKQPEATPPPEKSEPPAADAEKVNEWVLRATVEATDVDGLRALWKEIQQADLLDYVVEVDDKRTTLRDLVVRRKAEVEREAQAA